MSYDAFDEAPLDEADDARLIQRPDGSIVAKPHVKKVKTGTWVFYPNKKSEGRPFRTYGKAKKLGGEPDPTYVPKKNEIESEQEAEPVKQEMPEPVPIPQREMPRDEGGMFGIGGGVGSMFTEVLNPQQQQQRDQQRRRNVFDFLG